MKNEKLYNYLKTKEDLTPFEKSLLEDWGKEDIFGPWTEYEQPKDKTFKFYKSYYILDGGNKVTLIDNLL